MSEILEEYYDTFGEYFPVAMCIGMSDEQIAAIASGCIANKVPYDPPTDKDVYI